MNKRKINLVSSSPRRKELLSKIIPTFTVSAHKISEDMLKNEDGLSYVKKNSQQKS